MRTGDNDMTAGEIQGLRNWSDGGNLVTIGVGEARNQADTADLALPAPTNVSVAVSGIGGLDTGTIAPNKLYALYVAKVGATVGGILSTSFGSPTGVASFRRVGAVMTNANSQIVPFTQAGNKNERLVEYQGTPNVLLVVNNVASPGAFLDFDIVPPNPPGSRTARLHIVPTGGTTTLRTIEGGGEIVVVAPTTLGFTPPIGTNHGSFRTSPGSTATIRVTGFSDSL
jgi:hypothetical protein